jgi:hypothetical protein
VELEGGAAKFVEMQHCAGVALLSRKLAVYENERYNPVAGGWGSRGLLPTDRKPWSNSTGSAGYATLKEVDEALLSAGWRWEASWDVSTDTSTDSDGWSYSADFGWFDSGGVKQEGSTVQEGADILASDAAQSVEGLVGGSGGVSNKQMMHFVRRRRRTRLQTLDPELLTDFGALTCDWCDLEEVESVANVLLHALAVASVRAHPRSLTEQKCNKIKTELVNFLSLRGNDLISSGLYGHAVVASRLEEFSKGTGSAWSTVSSLVASGSPIEILGRRTADISAAYFSLQERRVLAGIVIRKHDATFQHHCDKHGCGAACEFRIERCPHDGCGTVYSSKWAKEHDIVCPQKIIPCARSCGDSCLRRLMQKHLSFACPLRPSECPYKDLGCMASLTHAEMPQHVEDSMPAHLLLSLARLQEQQGVIRDLHHRVAQLEGRHEHLATSHAKHAVAIAAAIETQSMRADKADKALRDDISALRKQASALDSAVSSHTSSLTKHGADIARVDAKVEKEVRPLLVALGAGKR